MKKIYTITAAIMICSFAFAQKPSFGVKAGLSSYSIKGDADNSLKSILEYTNGMVSTTSRTGFYGGAYASIPMGKGFAIEPGLYYSQKGYTVKGSLNIKGLEFLDGNATAKLQSDYLDIPVLLKADLGGLQVFAGPQFSYLMKSNLKTTAGALGFNLLDKSFDITSNFNKLDVGVTGGLGYQFNNGLNINASYDYGLSKIDANKNFSAYNRGFKVGLGLKL